MNPYYEHNGVTIYVGDCRDIIPQLTQKFDACVTDPPYGLQFMGREWDHGVPAKETWEAVSRVLKPGAHVMAFGGTRTFHRLACAIEDAGFEIRDTLMWLYGSGFPKSLDISKAIDKAARGVPQGGADPTSANHGKFKGGCSDDNPDGRGFGAGPGQFMKDSRSKYDGANRKPAPSTSSGFGYEAKGGIPESRPLTAEAQAWEGYGTALKPAWEPVILAMKPSDGTFADNALEHGVAGFNIDGSRIGTNKEVPASISDRKQSGVYQSWNGESGMETGHDPNVGRWPANALLDEEAAAALDMQTGKLSTTGRRTKDSQQAIVEGTAWGTNNHKSVEYPGDSGGASRFFYTAKASKSERGEGNTHPTVKPLDLMKYLCRLLAPPAGGYFLDPFMGSGSTLVACRELNIPVVGIEISKEYAEMAVSRLKQDVMYFAS